MHLVPIIRFVHEQTQIHSPTLKLVVSNVGQVNSLGNTM